LTADRQKLHPNGEDLTYVTAELVDAQGVINPKADNLIHFKVQGPGTIVGVGNANPISLESYQKPERKCWYGRCLVIVRANDRSGKIVVRASSEHLPDSLVTIAVDP